MRFPRKSGFKPLKRYDGAPTAAEARALQRRTAFHSRAARAGRPQPFQPPTPTAMPPKPPDTPQYTPESDKILLAVMKIVLEAPEDQAPRILELFRKGVELGKLLATEAKEGN